MQTPLRRRSILAATTIAATTLLARPAPADVSEPVLRTLVEDSDSVLEGRVRRSRATGRGLWHRFRVERVLAGEDPGEEVWLFTHGADVPEAPKLGKRRSVILGVRWLDEKDSFHARLLSSLDRREEGMREGLVGSDAVLDAHDLGDDDRAVLDIALKAAAKRRGDTAAAEAHGAERQTRATLLLGSAEPALRVEGLRLLASSDEKLAPETREAVRSAFDESLYSGDHATVLQAFLDLVRARRIDGCAGALCGIAVEREEPGIVEDAIAAIAELAPREGLEVALTTYPDAGPREKARIIRIVAAIDWSGASPLIGRALEDADEDVVQAGIQALGELDAQEATALLADIAKHSDGARRRLALEALARQRTAASGAAINRLLETLTPDERARLGRSLDRVRNPLRRRGGVKTVR